MESKYYRVTSCLFFFYLNHKLRMTIFGICFILYLLKLSAGHGFWLGLRSGFKFGQEIMLDVDEETVILLGF